MKILSAGQIKALDSYTIQEESITSLDLMEKAAMAFCEKFATYWNPKRPIVIFAGHGNNGGDALAIARILSGWDYSVEAYLFNTSNGLSADCSANCSRLKEVEKVTFKEITTQFTPPTLTKEHVVIDGLFGIGLARPLTGGFASMVQYINASPATVVSIDVPSGLMSEDNTGNNMANVIQADYTFTFHTPKISFFFAENEPYVGKFEVLDIGLADPDEDFSQTHYYTIEDSTIRPMLKPLKQFAHKGSMGTALLVAGSEGMAGAAVLAGKACIRSGAGKVIACTNVKNREILQISVPELIVNNPQNLTDLMENVNAIGVGPGLGTDQAAFNIVRNVLESCKSPLVVDADALNCIAASDSGLRILPKGAIITPHPKEFERLIHTSVNSYEALAKAIDLSKKLNIIIVLKGAYTRIVTPDGEVYFNTTGNPGMATAGSGDVLTGIILSLLAQQYTPQQAAIIGVYLHGLAGDKAAEKLSKHSLIASDIIEHLYLAFKCGE